jgi:aspartate kinase
MKVFKFGGASVKDASGVKNLGHILKQYDQDSTIVVVSAMGKTTNLLEQCITQWYERESQALAASLQQLSTYHNNIVAGLDISAAQMQVLEQNVGKWILELTNSFKETPTENYNFNYDQRVGYGELISTQIVADYLTAKNVACHWHDARQSIITDETHRDARVNWSETAIRLQALPFQDQPGQIHVFQGFIGRVLGKNISTTLGREGSDFTASIIAHCLNASQVVIWKDVAGVMSADPKIYDFAQKLTQISFEEAIALTYYGASVIHPKTVKPLMVANIPLYVKSFLQPNEEGTVIGNFEGLTNHLPCVILKQNQVLLAIENPDYSFIAEDLLAVIFNALYDQSLKANLIQNNPMQLSLCLDNDPYKLKPLLLSLQSRFKVTIQSDLSLINIRHYNPTIITQLKFNRRLIINQRTADTYQMVVA